jgi:beta-lactamase class C
MVLEDYTSYLIDRMQRTHTPGAALAIVQDSTILLLKGFGIKAIGTNDSVDVNTVFRIGSVSKSFASILTGVLKEQDQLDWNDYVVDYVPDFRLLSEEQTKNLQLRHVLSHTTGLPYHSYTNLVEEGRDLGDMLNELSTLKLIGKVGEVYSYQNVAYSLIGKVIEARMGKSYEKVMQEYLLHPLGMVNTSLNYNAFVNNPDIALPHAYYRRRLKVTSITDTYYNVAPAGGVNSSIKDMAQWMRALLGYREDIISKATLDDIYNPIVRTATRHRYFGNWGRLRKAYYAKGFRVLYYPNDTLIYHGGYVNGYRSEVAIDPRNNIAICILTNSPNNLIDKSASAFFDRYYARRDSILFWEKKKQINF